MRHNKTRYVIPLLFVVAAIGTVQLAVPTPTTRGHKMPGPDDAESPPDSAESPTVPNASAPTTNPQVVVGAQRVQVPPTATYSGASAPGTGQFSILGANGSVVVPPTTEPVGNAHVDSNGFQVSAAGTLGDSVGGPLYVPVLEVNAIDGASRPIAGTYTLVQNDNGNNTSAVFDVEAVPQLVAGGSSVTLVVPYALDDPESTAVWTINNSSGQQSDASNSVLPVPPIGTTVTDEFTVTVSSITPGVSATVTLTCANPDQIPGTGFTFYLRDGQTNTYTRDFDILGSASVNDAVAPLVSSASIDGLGNTLQVVWIEDDSPPVIGTAGFSLTSTGGAVDVTGTTTSGKTTLCTLSRTVYAGETLALAYSPGDFTDSATVPNVVAAFSAKPVTNGSAQVVTVLSPPAAPLAPVFGAYSDVSVNVLSQHLTVGASSETIQYSTDSTFSSGVTTITAASPGKYVNARIPLSSQPYYFRLVMIGPGGTTTGPYAALGKYYDLVFQDFGVQNRTLNSGNPLPIDQSLLPIGISMEPLEVSLATPGIAVSMVVAEYRFGRTIKTLQCDVDPSLTYANLMLTDLSQIPPGDYAFHWEYRVSGTLEATSSKIEVLVT